MVAIPFHCNGVLIDHSNLPGVIQVVFQMYTNIRVRYIRPKLDDQINKNHMTQYLVPYDQKTKYQCFASKVNE